MSTDQLPYTPSPHRTPPRTPLRLDRMVLGVIVIAVSVGWLLDNAGVDVPWRLAPAAGLVLVGLALVATVLGRGGGRGGLIGLGGGAAVRVGVRRAGLRLGVNGHRLDAVE